MNLVDRHNIKVIGERGPVIVLGHGFGCDQTMWKHVAPILANNYRVVLYDLMGCGKSDISMYSYSKYNSLNSYAMDLLEVIDEINSNAPVVFVGHSVSANIGLLASIESPNKFHSQVMVSPSPCFINDGDYNGGFTRADIEELCEAVESNFLKWSTSMAPIIMGAPEKPKLSAELGESFCRTEPEIAHHFARVTFFADHRADLPKCKIPTLILQCTEDFIAPTSVGDYLKQKLPKATLVKIKNVGHCPHMSAPQACLGAIDDFLKEYEFKHPAIL